jgi:NO-binding membrane sensor protein with MHYT domain
MICFSALGIAAEIDHSYQPTKHQVSNPTTSRGALARCLGVAHIYVTGMCSVQRKGKIMLNSIKR